MGHNIRLLKEVIGPKVKLLPLLKANAYGCGIAIVGKTAVENGADWLGVELVGEALELRRADITAPILTMGPVAVWQAELIVNNNLHVTVRDEETLNAISTHASNSQKKVPVHVELDTGLHRLGFQKDDALIFIQKILEKPFLELEGVWTHFASSDDQESNFTRFQFEKYVSFIKELKREASKSQSNMWQIPRLSSFIQKCV